MKDLQLSSEKILNSLNEGVYVCDLDRRIVFWSKSAERITWKTFSATSIRIITDCAVRSTAQCIVR